MTRRRRQLRLRRRRPRCCWPRSLAILIANCAQHDLPPRPPLRRPHALPREPSGRPAAARPELRGDGSGCSPRRSRMPPRLRSVGNAWCCWVASTATTPPRPPSPSSPPAVLSSAGATARSPARRSGREPRRPGLRLRRWPVQLLRSHPALRTRQRSRIARRAAPAAGLRRRGDALGNTAYIVGGYNGEHALDTILAWRPGGAPRLVGRLPVGLRYAAVAATGSRVIIAGGSTEAVGSTEAHASRAILSFDPSTGRVTRIGSLPAPLTHSSAASLGGMVYVIGGRGSAPDSQTAAILAIDPANGRVRHAGALVRAAIRRGRRDRGRAHRHRRRAERRRHAVLDL